MKNSKSKVINLAVILIFSIVSFINFSGCDEDTIVTPDITYGYLSVYNTVFPAQDLSIEINGVVAASNVSYTQRLSYQALIPGNNRLKIIGVGNITLVDTTFFISENNYYSAFIITSGGGVIPNIVTDNLTSPGSINSSVRFVNYAQGTVSIDAGADGKSSPWFPFVNYGEVENYRPITANTYTLYMKNAGTTDTLAVLIDQQFLPNKNYTILGKGIAGGSGTQALGMVVYLNE